MHCNARRIVPSPPPLYLSCLVSFSFPRAALWGDQIENNECRVTTWPALENVTELCDMTRFLQTLDVCAFRANVTRLLGALSRNATIFQILVCADLLFCLSLAAPVLFRLGGG